MGEEERGGGGRGEKIMMSMIVITDMDVMMTIKMMAAMVLMITCDVERY